MSNDFSHIGNAALKELEANHKPHHKKLWSKTSGVVVGNITHSPRTTWDQEKDPEDDHSKWLPTDLANLLAKTEVACDFASLSPPDNDFKIMIEDALKVVAQRSKDTDKKIIVRFLFGNVISAPVNCEAVITSFTEGLPTDSKLEIWVGAWRNGMCWNHAKIVAVDGKEVYTGGHNLWTEVYLKEDPIHDTSIHLTGDVAVQAHLFMNEQWKFIRKEQSTLKGWFVSKIPDGIPLPSVTRVTISEWPKKSKTYAPLIMQESEQIVIEDAVPIISLGRYGNIVDDARSSDDAFIAMFDAAQRSIKLLLQDLGPVNMVIAGKKIVYKSWPKDYLKAFSRAMFERGVDVEIVLSNIGSGEHRGNYSNGWSCEEVAAEIIKTMKEQFPEASIDQLKTKVKENLRVCFLRNKSGNEWASGNKVGLHSKVFIVDEVCTYVGSQNLYLFDLAEWGVAIDDEKKTSEIMESLWNPMWNASYLDGCDCDEDKVIEILDVDRDRCGKISEKELVRLDADIDLKELRKTDFYYS